MNSVTKQTILLNLAVVYKSILIFLTIGKPNYILLANSELTFTDVPKGTPLVTPPSLQYKCDL